MNKANRFLFIALFLISISIRLIHAQSIILGEEIKNLQFNETDFISMVTDDQSGFAYVLAINPSARIIKIRLSDHTVDQRRLIPLDHGVSPSCLVLDKKNGFIYVSMNGVGNSSGKVLRVNLLGLTIKDDVTFPGITRVKSMAMDKDNKILFLAVEVDLLDIRTSTWSTYILPAKISLPNFQVSTGGSWSPAGGIAHLSNANIDHEGLFGYFVVILKNSQSIVVKMNLATFEDSILLRVNEEIKTAALSDDGVGYFASDYYSSNSGKIYKVLLSDGKTSFKYIDNVNEITASWMDNAHNQFFLGGSAKQGGVNLFRFNTKSFLVDDFITLNGMANLSSLSGSSESGVLFASLSLSSGKILQFRTENPFHLTVNSGQLSGFYLAGTTVSIQADVIAGSVFDKWVGEAVSNSTSPITTLIMPSAPIVIAASYKKKFILTIQDGDGAGEYFAGTTVTIHALPPLSTFMEWRDNDSRNKSILVTSATSSVTTLIMPAENILIRSVYWGDPHVLTVIGGDGSGLYGYTQPITIHADPPPLGKRFRGWAGFSLYYTTPQITFEMPLRDLTVTAEYTAENYTLLVIGGSIDRSNNPGSFSIGTSVTVIANPPIDGMEFDKWEKSAGEFIQPSSSTSQFIMPATSSVITALYRRKAYPLTVVNGTRSQSYLFGSVVTISADVAPVGKVFDRWIGFDVLIATDPTTSLSMPSRDITVTAVYKPHLAHLTVKEGIGGGDYLFGTIVQIMPDPTVLNAGQKFFDYWEGPVINSREKNTTVELSSSVITVICHFKNKLGENDSSSNANDFIKFVNKGETTPNSPMKIQFSLTHPTSVKIDIHDLQGNLVRTLCDKEYSADLQTELWNGLNDQGELVVPDIYLAILKIDGNTKIKRIAILR